ncbi:ribosome biogenesis GTP-binding protein YihA/YsxC [soil metagenome]
MHIKSVEFIGAIGQVGQAAPEAAKGLPQVAFSGRSNVGKSSLINRLLGRTRSPIARVSQQPGKTQEINFYQVRTDRGEFCLVDLPGYGYARVPQALRGRWQPLIDGYLRSSPELAGVVQLIDIRHGPTADDSRAIEYLAAAGIPVLFALTKSDKLTVTRRGQAVREIVGALGLEADQVIPFSATTGEGRDDLIESLAVLVAADGDGATAETA